MYYAELREDNKVKALLDTHGTFDVPNMIKIDSLDDSLLGKIYSNGEFINDPTPVPKTKNQKAAETMAGLNVAELDKTDIGRAVKALLYNAGLLKI